jgi:hypothetical protein
VPERRFGLGTKLDGIWVHTDYTVTAFNAACQADQARRNGTCNDRRSETDPANE